MGPGLTRIFFWKIIPKYSYTCILEKYTICIMSVYTLLNVVSYYDLSVLSMSVMGFQKKLDGM